MRQDEIGQSYDAIAQRWQEPQMQSIGISQLDRAVQFTTAREYALDIGCSCSGRFIDRVITHGLQVASGIIIGCQDAAVHGALSAALGQPVVLAQEAEISHHDAGPIHILTSASLAWLRAALPDAGIDERRFRPNLVVDLPGQGLVEQEWIGRRLRVGREVQLEVTMGTERCGMITFSQSELGEEPSVLRDITREAGIQFGVYAKIVVPGCIQLNDPVDLSTDSRPASP